MRWKNWFFAAALTALVAGCGEKEEEMLSGWDCKICGEQHIGLPFVYGPDVPDPYSEIPEAERAERCQTDKNFCVIDKRHFFVRGRLEIPVTDADETFTWNVWVSLSEPNFKRIIQLLKEGGDESAKPAFGSLSNRLPFYPETTALKANLRVRAAGELPLVELQDADHPLVVEQRDGIKLERVHEISAEILHQGAKPVTSS